MYGYFEGHTYISPYDIPPSIENLFMNNGVHSDLSGISYEAAIYANESGSRYPQRPIRLPVEWLEYLNPVSTLVNGTNATVINAYLSPFSEFGRIPTYLLAEILTQVLGTGLSLYGADLPWQGNQLTQPPSLLS